MRFPLYILAVVLPQPMTVATAAEPDCARIEFPLETHYSVSAAQTTDGDLLVLDFRNERLIRVDLQDGSWGAVGGWAGEVLRDRQPVAIRSSGSNVLLEQASPARLVALDPHDLGIRPGMTYQVNESVGTEGHVLDSMWTWEVVGSDVVACSDLYVGTGRVEDQDNWYCPFRRIRPPIPLEGGRWSERSDARGSGWLKVAAIGRLSSLPVLLSGAQLSFRS
jgi:hypothetical protein